MSDAFDSALFGRWLRTLMVAFYDDDEIVLADLLCQREALLRDREIAQRVCLPEKQVNSILERRLVRHCLIERVAEGEGSRAKTFYRVSSLAIAAAEHRLQATEDSLATDVAERYRCSGCGQSYDTMQAMKLEFRCCQALEREGAEAGRQERLKRFQLQCRDLRLLTQKVKAMAVPQFDKEERLKPRPPSPSPVRLTARPAAPTDDLWFATEVLGEHGQAPQRSQQQDPSRDMALQEAIRRANGRMKEQHRRLSDARRWPGAPRTEPLVIVGGEARSLSHVRDSEELQDRMTDEEYQRFFDLERDSVH